MWHAAHTYIHVPKVILTPLNPAILIQSASTLRNTSTKHSRIPCYIAYTNRYTFSTRSFHTPHVYYTQEYSRNGLNSLAVLICPSHMVDGNPVPTAI